MNESPGNRDDGSQEPVHVQIAPRRLDELIADFEATYGPVPDELLEKAMREWPDYEAR
jgi:hypothetical protein